MSPEQATGQEHTPAGDVFALAGVLVFAASGHGPFGSGQPADLLYRVRYADPDLTGVSQPLIPILARCLSKDPDQRPTTLELAAQLHDGQGQFADHLPDLLLADIARRATEVWRHQPHRLPAPADGDATASPSQGTPAVSRRKLLALGGGSVAAVAAAGVGAWSWFGGESPGRNATPKDLGISAPSPKKHGEDYLWQVRVSNPPGGKHPAAAAVPFVVGDVLALTVRSGLAAVDPRTGKTAWTTGGLEYSWQVTSDGEQLYRIATSIESGGQNGKASPMFIETIDPTTGKLKRRLPQLNGFNGAILENQLVCASAGVVYLAAGQGADTKAGFQKDQPWFLAAVDTGTGKEVWRQPLSAKAEGSERLHFLSGRVAGDRLVLLEEISEGTVRVVAHNALTGKPLWDKPMPGAKPDQARGLPATDDKHIYLGLGALRALRLSDGGEVWRCDSFRDNGFGPPVVANGVVYAVEKNVSARGLNTESGGVEWLGSMGYRVAIDTIDPPIIGREHLYTLGARGLRAVSLDDFGKTSLEYKTTGTRFVAHDRAQVLIALGSNVLSAFPLQ